mgnify:CR=1 FL=1
MAYVPVPKDLTAVKSKVFLNLTKRQLICFGGGALIGVPLFSVIYYLATVLVNEKAEKRGLKTADEFYYAVDRYDTAAGEFVMMDENAAKKRRNPRKDGKEPIVKRIGNRFRRKK